MGIFSKKEIIFVSPGPHGQGGISVVVNNYSRSAFWAENDCYHYATCLETDSKLKKALFSISSVFLFPLIVLLFRPATVSIHSSSGWSFYRKLLIILFSRLLGKNIIWHIHPSHFYDFFQSGSSIRRWLINLAAKQSQKIVFLTEKMHSRFSEIWPKGKLAVLPNPVNVSEYSKARLTTFKGNRHILYLGWITQQKGVYDLLDIVPEIIQDFPDVQFHFAGNQEVEKLKSLVIERNLSKNVVVHGWVAGQDKLNLLKSARFLILPSYTEGIPNAILEAMASGLPVITTPVGGIPSIFEEGVNGFYVLPGDRAGLVTTIQKLLLDDPLCLRLSKSTYQRALSHFDVEIVGKKLKQIYL